ncbi:hypothetical protein [Catellatospora sp. IY07-71]|nr:hypothetical protein [Catellatospora sp. IY07-71]
MSRCVPDPAAWARVVRRAEQTTALYADTPRREGVSRAEESRPW